MDTYKIEIIKSEQSNKIKELIRQNNLFHDLASSAYQLGKTEHFDLMEELIKQNQDKIINILSKFNQAAAGGFLVFKKENKGEI